MDEQIIRFEEYRTFISSNSDLLLPNLMHMVVDYLIPCLVIDDITWTQLVLYSRLRQRNIFRDGIKSKLRFIKRLDMPIIRCLPFNIPDSGEWPEKNQAELKHWWESMVDLLDRPLINPAPAFWQIYRPLINPTPAFWQIYRHPEIFESAKMIRFLDWRDTFRDVFSTSLETLTGEGKEVVNITSALSLRLLVHLGIDCLREGGHAIPIRLVGFRRHRIEVVIVQFDVT